MPINDDINFATAFRLLNKNKPRPTACCPKDGEPLIPTMERRGAEFHCMICGGWLGFLAPIPKDPIVELDKRYEELKARFDSGERGPIDSIEGD